MFATSLADVFKPYERKVAANDEDFIYSLLNNDVFPQTTIKFQKEFKNLISKEIRLRKQQGMILIMEIFLKSCWKKVLLYLL